MDHSAGEGASCQHHIEGVGVGPVRVGGDGVGVLALAS